MVTFNPISRYDSINVLVVYISVFTAIFCLSPV